MLKIGSKQKPKNRIKLYGTSIVSFGINSNCFMIRSRVLGTKTQINFN